MKEGWKKLKWKEIQIKENRLPACSQLRLWNSVGYFYRKTRQCCVDGWTDVTDSETRRQEDRPTTQSVTWISVRYLSSPGSCHIPVSRKESQYLRTKLELFWQESGEDSDQLMSKIFKCPLWDEPATLHQFDLPEEAGSELSNHTWAKHPPDSGLLWKILIGGCVFCPGMTLSHVLLFIQALWGRPTCAYSRGPAWRPAAPCRARAAGSGTAPGSPTWPCGLWRFCSWWSEPRSAGDRSDTERRRDIEAGDSRSDITVLDYCGYQLNIELFHPQLFDHIKISTFVLRTVWYIIFNSLCNRAGTSPRPPARGCPRSCFSWRGRSAPETSAAQGDKSETETSGGLRGCKKEQSMKNNAFICRVF